MISWDDVFMTKVKGDSPTKTNERHSTGLIESSVGKQAYRQAQGAQKRSGIRRLLMHVHLSKISCQFAYMVGITSRRPCVVEQGVGDASLAQQQVLLRSIARIAFDTHLSKSGRWYRRIDILDLTASGLTCALVADSVGTGWKEESLALPSRLGNIPTLDSGSTLLVAGSLFVGSGLGVKKTPTVFAGGSAKNMCRKILDEHSRA